MAKILPIDTIISDDTIREGQPIIAGNGIRVSDLVASHLYRGHSPESLAVNYKLSLGQVYAALAYYYQHKQAFEVLFEQETNRAEDYLAALEQDGRLIRVE